MRILTKSKFVYGKSCPRYLWMLFHAPEMIPDRSVSDVARMQQGTQVGELATTLFPDALELHIEQDFNEGLELSTRWLKKRKVMLEPGFSYDNCYKKNDCYARADILVPVNEDEWDIIEVKSGTKIKEEHIEDLAFQRYVYTNCGLKIRKCILMHINNEYERKGDIDANHLFTQEDVTEEVLEYSKNIEGDIKTVFDIIARDTIPELSEHEHDYKTKECHLAGCFDHLPEYPVYELYRGGKVISQLVEKDILDLRRIPQDTMLTPNQTIQVQSTKENKPYVDKDGLQRFLRTMTSKQCFLDFESLNPAIPPYDGMKPYEQLCFQFCLVNDEHVTNFLHLGADDPRPHFIQALKDTIPPFRTIVVYNKSFEIGRLKDLARWFPQDKEFLLSLIPRIVDLMEPFRNFMYYNPSQHGSASFKAVLPALTGKSYDDLVISNGGDASALYSALIHGTDKEPEKTRSALIEYCQQDTQGMKWIVDALKQLV